MKKIKKSKLLILLVAFSFICIYGFTFAKYATNSIWDYYLTSNGFYFSSNYLGLNEVKNINNLWDGESINFNVNNSLNQSVVTGYDINYTITCTIEGEAASYSECHLNGTTSNTHNGVLSSSQSCVNNTEDQVDVSLYNKAECELGSYDWENIIATTGIYFDVVLTDIQHEIKDVIVNVVATSTSPYNKTLSGEFILHKEDVATSSVTLSYENYSDYDRLIVSNSHSIDKCVTITWDANNLIIDADNSLFNYYDTDSNGYINDIRLDIGAEETLSYIFYKKDFSVTYDVSEFIIEESCAIEVEDGPELATGMIPVYYDEVNFVWKKADRTTDDWYDYDAFKWANAVTVTSATRDTHNAAAVGTTIPMTDINTMFVWIPRYKYRIPSGTGPREIDVVFETKDITKSNGDAVTTYYTHPAFTFGTSELNGIWIGKFEITGTVTSPTIKPNVASIRNQTVRALSEMIKAKFQSSSDYGFTSDSDVHMMKNMEWAAATYLYYSKYGKYGNTDYSGTGKELFLNNSTGYITGRSMGAPGSLGIKTPSNEYIAAGYYTYDGTCATIHSNLPAPCNTGSVGQILSNKNLAYGASTTGTVYGVYDMSGGSWDYVVGMYMPNPVPATGISDRSGFSTTITNSQFDLLNIETKYYDRYLTSSLSTGAKLGDATKEVSGWYGDYPNYVSTGYPWFVRGGNNTHGVNAGGFAFRNVIGGTVIDTSTRVILVPQE